jgi:hypothetical protein
MKKTLYSILAIVTIATVAASCKKSDSGSTTPTYTCATCKTTPDGIAANDASSKGVYKGVVIGSTGTIMFNILNGGTTITATMVLDGATINLTSAVTWVAGVSYVAPFTGTFSGGTITINFSVSASGGTPIITTSSIPGHPNSSFTVIKETSTSLIECYEGTYHTTLPEDGTFNLLLSRSLKAWRADARKAGTTGTNSEDGTITSDNKLVESGGKIVGTLSGDAISGDSQDNNGKTVSISAKRTF